MKLSDRCELSIVIPVMNEEGNIDALWQEIRDTLEPKRISFEVIFVDDGSRDRSPEIIADMSRKDGRVKAVIFRRNFGQTAAMAAGLDHASGDILVFMDADRQNDPRDIPVLIEKLRSGYDVVCGWRKDRKDKTVSRKIPSKIANWLTRKIAGVEIHDLGCSLKAFTMELMRDVKLYGEMHRFIPIYATAVGARIAEVVVNHRPRTAGVTKYGLKRTFKVLLDLVTVTFLLAYFRRPMHFFGGLGFLMLMASALLAVPMLLGAYAPSSGVLALLSLGLTAVTSVLMGLLAEVQIRTYYESQAKPSYKVRKTIGWAAPQSLREVKDVVELRSL
jgi:glycosyltransferase involved in cell wall biosynthesis